MAWNNGLERKRFDEEQEKLAAEYRAAGMTEEQIEQMHLFDLEAFNSRRRFCEHTQQFPELPENIDEEDGFSPIFDKFIDELSVDMNASDFRGRYWWIEEIDDPELAKKIKTLSKDDIELITLHVYESFTQEEIGEQLGISQRAVGKRIEKLRNIFKKIWLNHFFCGMSEYDN